MPITFGDPSQDATQANIAQQQALANAMMQQTSGAPYIPATDSRLGQGMSGLAYVLKAIAGAKAQDNSTTMQNDLQAQQQANLQNTIQQYNDAEYGKAGSVAGDAVTGPNDMPGPGDQPSIATPNTPADPAAARNILAQALASNDPRLQSFAKIQMTQNPNQGMPTATQLMGQGKWTGASVADALANGNDPKRLVAAPEEAPDSSPSFITDPNGRVWGVGANMHPAPGATAGAAAADPTDPTDPSANQPSDAAIQQAATAYRLQGKQGLLASGFGSDKNFINSVRNAVAQQHLDEGTSPADDLAARDETKALQSGLTAQTKNMGQLTASMGTLERNGQALLPLIGQRDAQAWATGTPAFDKFLTAAAAQYGDPAASQVRAQVGVLAPELGKVLTTISGGNSTLSDHARDEALELLQGGSLDEPTMAKVLGVFSNDANARLQSTQQSIAGIRARIADPKRLLPGNSWNPGIGVPAMQPTAGTPSAGQVATPGNTVQPFAQYYQNLLSTGGGQ